MVTTQNVNLTSLDNGKVKLRCQKLGSREWREEFKGKASVWGFLFFVFNISAYFFFLTLGLFNLFIYLFMTVLGLRFCARAFSSCGKRRPLFIAVRGPLVIAASLVAERRLSNCGSRA